MGVASRQRGSCHVMTKKENSLLCASRENFLLCASRENFLLCASRENFLLCATSRPKKRIPCFVPQERTSCFVPQEKSCPVTTKKENSLLCDQREDKFNFWQFNLPTIKGENVRVLSGFCVFIFLISLFRIHQKENSNIFLNRFNICYI